MKFKEIMHLIGTTTALVNPVVGGAILAINKILPSHKQLPPEAKLTLRARATITYQSLH